MLGDSSLEVWAPTQLSQAGLLCFTKQGSIRGCGGALGTCIDVCGFATKAGGILSTGGSSGRFVMPQLWNGNFVMLRGIENSLGQKKPSLRSSVVRGVCIHMEFCFIKFLSTAGIFFINHDCRVGSQG